MEKRAPSPLTVGAEYSGVIEAGDRLKIGADRTVSRLTDPYDPYVGQVYTKSTELGECVFVTPYVWHRDDRIAGEAIQPGYFVLGPDNKIFQYTPAKPARHDGTTTGPQDITLDTNDVIKLKLEGGSSQSITLDAGTGRTFAAIAAEVNVELTGMKLEVDAAGNLNIVLLEIGKSVEVETVTHQAYTALGWTVGVYQPTNASHDPTCVKGIALTAAAKDAAVETLEM